MNETVQPKSIPDRVRALFDGRPIAFVTTMRPDGRMSTNPMAVVLEGETIRLSTTIDRKKYRNLQVDSRITICVVQPDNLNRYVEIRGRAKVEPDTGRRFIDSVARRYMDVDRYPFDTRGEERVVIRVIPEAISSPGIPLAEKPPYPKPPASQA